MYSRAFFTAGRSLPSGLGATWGSDCGRSDRCIATNGQRRNTRHDALNDLAAAYLHGCGLQPELRLPVAVQRIKRTNEASDRRLDAVGNIVLLASPGVRWIWRSDLGNVTALRNATPLATFAGAVTTGSCGHSAAEAGAGIGGAPCVTASEFAIRHGRFRKPLTELAARSWIFRHRYAVDEELQTRRADGIRVGRHSVQRPESPRLRLASEQRHQPLAG